VLWCVVLLCLQGVCVAPPGPEGLVDPDVKAEEAKIRDLLEQRAGGCVGHAENTRNLQQGVGNTAVN
jgi:hypothetical protein